MTHGFSRGPWLLLALVLPATGVVALRHAGTAAHPDGRPTNARIWVTELPGRQGGEEAGEVTLQSLSLVPPDGAAEIPLASPTGTPLRLERQALRRGRIALAGAGTVPVGRYAALRVGLPGASVDLPIDVSLGAGRELDLVVDVDRAQGAARPRARIASLEQR